MLSTFTRWLPLLLLAGCGASSPHGDGGTPDLSASDLAGSHADLATSHADFAGSTADLSLASTTDGAPMREACTSSFGSGLSGSYGRLDGYLVAVVPPTQSNCSGDSNHVHLQVKAQGSVYDIAVNVKDDAGGAVYYLATDHAPIGAAWTEGWHSTATKLDYPNNLGLSSTTFASTPETQLASDVEKELANANHVSIYASTYTDGSGAHLVHRNNGYDGAIVVDPLSATARFLTFHFSTQSF